MPDVLEQGLLDIFSQLSVKPIEPAPTLETHVSPPQPPALAAPVVVGPPKVEPAPAAIPVVAPVVVDLDKPIENWDVDPTDPVTPAAQVVDFQSIAKELGFENITTKEELAKQVSEIKIKAEAPSKNIEVLPEDLAKAVDIAKQGGNYLEYLKVSAVDWSKQDPILLFENMVYSSMAKSGKTVDEIDAYLDKIDDFDKEFRGRDLQAQYSNIQQQQRSAIEAQTRAEKSQFDNAVQTALHSISDVYGFKVSEPQKETLYRQFTSTPIGRALLAQTGGDYKQALTGLFNINYGAKIDQIRKQQIKSATKRELLEELTNPKITTPANITTPLSNEKVDPIKTYFDEIKIKTGL